MKKTHSDSVEADTLTLRDFERYAQGWLLDGDIRQLADRTLEERRTVLARFAWWLAEKQHEAVDSLVVRGFLAYVGRAHEQPGGRWGKGKEDPRCARPLKATGALAYFRTLRGLFRWLEEERPGFVSPMATLKPPRLPKDKPLPFTREEILALQQAARAGAYPVRDTALLLFLLDTGCRASELCGICVEDLDLPGRKVRVLGKGGKERTLYFGRDTLRAVWAQVGTLRNQEEGPLFPAARGRRPAEALTANGLGQVIRRHGRRANIRGARCSPHTFRHTFAVSFLRNGGNALTLRELLGHESLSMVQKYVTLAEADLERQARHYSPVDNLRKKR